MLSIDDTIKSGVFFCVGLSFFRLSDFGSKKIKRTMQQVCHSERSAAKSKNLPRVVKLLGEIGA